MKSTLFASLTLLASSVVCVLAVKPEKLTPLRVDLAALQSSEGLQLERKSARTESVEVDSREAMPHKNAKWITTPLAKREGQYTAMLKTKGVDLGRLHYYIRARVRLGQVSGWLSSPVHQLQGKQ